VKIQKCSTGWTESGSTPYTYTCGGGGTITTVLAEKPVATVKATPPTLSGLGSLNSGASDGLRAVFELPAASSTATQGKTSQLSITFTATQRARTDK